MKKDKWLVVKIVGVIVASLALLWVIFDQFILDEDCGEEEENEEDIEDFYDEDLD